MRVIWKRSVQRLSLAAMFMALNGCEHNVPARQEGRPPNIEDACAITADRAEWALALRDVRSTHGVDPAIVLGIIWRESRFEQYARPPKTWLLGFVPTGRASSAFGYAQAIDSTWEWYQRANQAPAARRDRFADAVDFVGWYMNLTRSLNNVPLQDAERQYLAYHEGHSGYSRGSYRVKGFLLNAAREVRVQSARYADQLRRCPIGE